MLQPIQKKHKENICIIHLLSYSTNVACMPCMVMPFNRTSCKYSEMVKNGPKLNSIATFCINKCISLRGANYSQVVLVI